MDDKLDQLFQEAQDLLDEGKYTESIQLINQMIEINPDDYQNYFNKALALYYQNNYTEAEATFQKAIDIKPDFDQAMAFKALCMTPEDALIYLNQELESQPELIELYFMKGVTLSELEKHSEAIETYQEGLQYGLTREDIIKPVAENYYAQENYTESKKLYTEILENNPEDPVSWVMLAESEASLKEYTSALSHIEKAIRLDPELDVAYFTKGNLLYTQDQLEEALKNYIQAYQLDPSYEQAHTAIMTLLKELNREEEIRNYPLEEEEPCACGGTHHHH